MSDSIRHAPRIDLVVRRILVTVAAAATVGCSSGKEEGRGTATPPATASTTTATAGVGDSTKPACPMEGDWTPCAVEDRLVHAGVVIEKQDEPARYPFFSVPGVTYHVGSAEHQLLVFLYPSAQARAKDTALLDSASVAPRGTHVTWPAPPTLIVSNNLAAVILSLNDRTVERLALALSAGLPQPAAR